MGVNVSLRKGYARTRAPINKKTLVFPDPITATTFEKGLFQGAGYYRPDFGTESLLVQISGHIFKCTEAGTSWIISDISISGDLNNATTQQVWMWQSEKWMIINDGTGALPIFFDGTTSRRSFGESQLWGTTAADFTPPAIGATVGLTLVAPYAGQYNVPVLLNGEFYQPISGSVLNNYPALLTNISDTPTDTIPSGSQIFVIPQNIGWAQVATSFNIDGGGNKNHQVFFQFDTSIPVIPDGSKVIATNANGHNVTLIINRNVSVAGQYKTAFLSGWGNENNFSGNQLIVYASNTQPTVLIGTTSASFTVPATDSSVQVNLSSPYSGSPNQPVWINNQQYLISPVPTPPPTNLLTVINLTDTDVNPVVAPKEILSVPELPAGRMGAYGMGRNWFSLIDGISYEAGDIVGGASGTPANNYRDSVLKTTENDFLSGGGTFRLPGSGDIITAMIFPPILDSSLGQGQLQVCTPFSMFSNNSPVDRTVWTALTSPLQTESLRDKGTLGQNSTILVNSDIFFRSYDGIGSLIMARREFYDWGNKPVSNELQRILSLDNQSLLPYGSAVSFDNRYLSTCAPNVSGRGVFHRGMISLNFDLLSSLRTNLPPAWEGAFSGINTLQILAGRVNGFRRCFAFTYNITDTKIELHEIISEAAAEQAGQTMDDGVTPIQWFFETAVLFNKDVKPLTQFIKLINGEIALSNIRGKVNVNVLYRPLWRTCWSKWRSFSVCSDMSDPNAQSQYRSRLGLGTPDGTVCDPTNNTPMREGLGFQFRIEIEGSCAFEGLRAEAVEIPEPKYAPVEGC